MNCVYETFLYKEERRPETRPGKVKLLVRLFSSAIAILGIIAILDALFVSLVAGVIAYAQDPPTIGMGAAHHHFWAAQAVVALIATIIGLLTWAWSRPWA